MYFNLNIKFFLIDNNRLGLLENHMKTINHETKTIVQKIKIIYSIIIYLDKQANNKY